uniref:Orf158 n=1 Tax=Batis maritima TaxID=4436 RepID=A0A068BCZ4_BATMA|nr:orf158 [Batis maritima]AIC83317.1 orf158 [Batis maritima]
MELLLQRIILKNYNIGFFLAHQRLRPLKNQKNNLMIDSLHQYSGLFPGVLSSLRGKMAVIPASTHSSDNIYPQGHNVIRKVFLPESDWVGEDNSFKALTYIPRKTFPATEEKIARCFDSIKKVPSSSALSSSSGSSKRKKKRVQRREDSQEVYKQISP